MHARRMIEVQVEATDREIAALVYGLTPDERAVVEAAVAPNGEPGRGTFSAPALRS